MSSNKPEHLPQLSRGSEDINSKKGDHDGSDQVEDSQNDIIKSDEKEIVIKVKRGQTIKIINDADDSIMNLTKHPADVGYSITSTSKSKNETSRASFSFGRNLINNINSSIANLATIQVVAPADNSSILTIQISPPVFTMNMEPSENGMFETFRWQPSEYYPGASVIRSDSNFKANGAIINGNNNTIDGNGNVINGCNCFITGDNNKVNGSNNKIFGDSNESFGCINSTKGFNNKTTGPKTINIDEPEVEN